MTGVSVMKSARRWFAVTAWCLLAQAASRSVGQENLLGFPNKAVTNSGTLVIGGGGSLPEAVYDEFVKLAGGKRARIVMIPTAYPFSSKAAVRSAYGGWLSYDVVSFDFLDTDSREEADTNAFVRPLERATGVWIGGGMQGRLTDLYVGTKVEKAIKGVLERGGVVGGTSAGSAIMSKVMIRYGTSEAVVDKGLGLLQKAVIDQHFRQRRRTDRLIGVLVDHPQMFGLGVDEDTALFVTGNRLRVVGDSRVTICASSATGEPVWVRRLNAGQHVDLVSLTKNVDEQRPAIALKPGK
jgi:cyanophycinase